VKQKTYYRVKAAVDYLQIGSRRSIHRLKSFVILAAIACMAGVTATATASVVHPASTHRFELTVKSTSVGKILVLNGGLIVYDFTHDKKNKNTCPASTGCAAQWPALVGNPTLGPGVKKSLIGHIKDGSKSQVTYNGHPLYGYIYNSAAITYISYVQFGGAWDAVSPSGGSVANHNDGS
jgi:predicted lipoprotein with Yx(FWY)xxD motif